MATIPPQSVITENTYALPGVSEDGKTIEKRGRIKDAQSALNCYLTMQRDDQLAAFNRTKVQAMFDGLPPRSQAEMQRMGQGNCANANWGQGIELLEEAKAPYPGLIQNTEVLCTMPLKHDFGDENLRADWQPIIEEEFTVMLRKWCGFYPNFLQLVHQVKAHGVGVMYWEDALDWRYSVDGLQRFKFPRNVKPDADCIELCGCEIAMLPHVLYSKIRNPEIAAQLGWDVKVCRESIVKAQPNLPMYTDWEWWEQSFKNNDYLLSFNGEGEQPTINVVLLLAKEADGTVSQYLVNRDNPGLGFLFKKEGRFASMGSQMVIFTDGVGSNGTLHSIRGLGQIIFSKVLADNQLFNRMIDLAIFTATPIFEQTDEDQLQTDALIPVGAFNVLGSGWAFPDRQMPDYERSLMPMVQTLRDRMISASARYTQTAPTLQGRQPSTKYGEQVRQQSLASLNDAEINLFMAPWERGLKNVVRRVIRKNYMNMEPGGHEVAEFKRRCLIRGVPTQAIEHIDVDSVRAVIPLGAGSPANRTMILEQLMPIVPSMDQTGQSYFRRDYTIAVAGVQAANRYTPNGPMRTPADVPLATGQNSLLRQGFPQPVYDTDNNIVHAQTHLAGENGIQSIIMQMQPEGEMPITESIPQLEPLYLHGMEHLQLADPNNPLTRELTQEYQQVSGILHNGALQLQKLEEQAMRDAEGGLGSQNGQMTGITGEGGPEQGQGLKIIQNVLESQAKLKIMQQKADQEMSIKQARANQDLAIKDAQAAYDLRRKAMMETAA
jgi:hypothetical protein